MRGKLHVDHVVDIKPFGMMLHLLGQFSNLGHPSPGHLKVRKVVCFLNGIPPRRILR
jgi:hypothetical protein